MQRSDAGQHFRSNSTQQHPLHHSLQVQPVQQQNHPFYQSLRQQTATVSTARSVPTVRGRFTCPPLQQKPLSSIHVRLPVVSSVSSSSYCENGTFMSRSANNSFHNNHEANNNPVQQQQQQSLKLGMNNNSGDVFASVNSPSNSTLHAGRGNFVDSGSRGLSVYVNSSSIETRHDKRTTNLPKQVGQPNLMLEQAIRSGVRAPSSTEQPNLMLEQAIRSGVRAPSSTEQPNLMLEQASRSGVRAPSSTEQKYVLNYSSHQRSPPALPSFNRTLSSTSTIQFNDHSEHNLFQPDLLYYENNNKISEQNQNIQDKDDFSFNFDSAYDSASSNVYTSNDEHLDSDFQALFSSELHSSTTDPGSAPPVYTSGNNYISLEGNIPDNGIQHSIGQEVVQNRLPNLLGQRACSVENLKLECELQSSPLSGCSQQSVHIEFDPSSTASSTPVPTFASHLSPTHSHQFSDVRERNPPHCVSYMTQDTNVVGDIVVENSSVEDHSFLYFDDQSHRLSSEANNLRLSEIDASTNQFSSQASDNYHVIVKEQPHTPEISINSNELLAFPQSQNTNNKCESMHISSGVLKDIRTVRASSGLDTAQLSPLVYSNSGTTCELGTFTKPLPVSPSVNANGGNLSVRWHSVRPNIDSSIKMHHVQYNMQSPKIEPAFTPPASPFEGNTFGGGFSCSPQPVCTTSSLSPLHFSSHLDKNSIPAELPPSLSYAKPFGESPGMKNCQRNISSDSQVVIHQHLPGFSASSELNATVHSQRPPETVSFKTECVSKRIIDPSLLNENRGIQNHDYEKDSNWKSSKTEVNPDIQTMINEEKQNAHLPDQHISPPAQNCAILCMPISGGKSKRGRRPKGNCRQKGLRIRTDVQGDHDFYEVQLPSPGCTNPKSASEETVPVMKIRRKSSLDKSLPSTTLRCKQSTSKKEHTVNLSRSKKFFSERDCITDRSNSPELSGNNMKANFLGFPPSDAAFGGFSSSSSLKRMESSEAPSKRPRKSSCSPVSSGAKICGVCGDSAKSMHFGGMACDSCKAFFRRSVQSRTYCDFRCSAENRCFISKKNRKNCQYCRFTKCRQNGMEVTYVMTESQRMELWKTRLSKHRKGNTSLDDVASNSVPKNRTSSETSTSISKNSQDFDDLEIDESSVPDYSSDTGSQTSSCGGVARGQSLSSKSSGRHHIIRDVDNEMNSIGKTADQLPEDDEALEFIEMKDGTSTGGIVGCSINTFDPEFPLDNEDIILINNLIALQDAVFLAIPYPKHCFDGNTEALGSVFICICKKIGTFFQRVEDFHTICREDQMALLRSGISMTIYLHGAYAYDHEKKTWPRPDCKESLRVPPVSKETLLKYAGMMEAFSLIVGFYEAYGRDLRDEGVLVLLSLIAVFQAATNASEIVDCQNICNFREKYIQVLGRYLQFRMGITGLTVTLPKLLRGLEETRKIAEYHSRVDIKHSMSENEITLFSTNTSFTNQMTAVRDLMKDVTSGYLSGYSSVFASSDENAHLNDNLLAGLDSSLLSTSSTLPAFLSKTSNLQLRVHHPLTEAIFGPHDRTDMLYCNTIEQITQIKQKIMSIPYEPSSFQQYRCPQSVPSISSSAGGESTSVDSSLKPTSEKDRTAAESNLLTDSDDSLHDVNTVVTEKSDIRTGSTSLPAATFGTNSSKESGETSSKQKGIKVLCELLEYISKCDDSEAIESLQKSLAPQVLRNLASKLNVSELLPPQ